MYRGRPKQIADWKIASTCSTLAPNDIHVWRVHIPSVLGCLSYLNSLLSADEQEKAIQFYRELDRRRYVVGRGVLRYLLSGYVGDSPKSIVFRYGLYGKPEVDVSPPVDCISFNLSHSHEWVVYAFARRRAVGIDIELVRPGIDYYLMAQTVFSETERQWFNVLPIQERVSAFLDLWTLKEAYVKAIGTGFSLMPTEIETSLGSNGSPRLLRTSQKTDTGRWSIQTLEVADNYIGSMLVEGPIHEPLFMEWHWDPSRF